MILIVNSLKSVLSGIAFVNNSNQVLNKVLIAKRKTRVLFLFDLLNSRGSGFENKRHDVTLWSGFENKRNLRNCGTFWRVFAACSREMAKPALR